MQSWVVVCTSALYLMVLFAIAWWGERLAKGRPLFARGSIAGATVYALALAIHNTAWSFYGSIGRAASSGWMYLPTYIGPVLLLIFGHRLLRRVIAVSKARNITSIADFIGERYGKSRSIAAFVTIAALIGILPYIALQLKAIAVSFDVLTAAAASAPHEWPRFFEDTSFWAAAIVAVFTIAFGVRHVHASERHRGFILALAFESLVKLAAFSAVSLYVVYGLFDGIGDLLTRASKDAHAARLLDVGVADFFNPAWYSIAAGSFLAFLCLPQSFHVAVVENDDPANVGQARWLYPAYVVILASFMMPLALAGVLTFANTISPDTFTIALPVAAGAPVMALLTFIGGLSAATGMLIVSTVALSTMLCNDVIMPFFLRKLDKTSDVTKRLLLIRRGLVFLILFLAFAMRWLIDETFSLTQFGLVSFVAIAQFGPAFFGGLIWQRASPTGALAGMAAGFTVWLYTLLIPATAPVLHIPQSFLDQGPQGVSWLRPCHLFGMDSLDPVSNATLWSLAFNLYLFVFLSFLHRPSKAENEQTSEFLAAPALADLHALAAQWVGADQADAGFRDYLRERGERAGETFTLARAADSDAIRFTETLIAGAIGAASARRVVAAFVGGHAWPSDASDALLANHRLLSAIMKTVRQGICAVDAERRISAWNSRFMAILDLPPGFLKVGMRLSEVVEYNSGRGEYNADQLRLLFVNRDLTTQPWPYVYERTRPDGSVLEVIFDRMDDGGYVGTYADVTERHRAARTLAAENADRNKTRFLAAASHDLRQPLSAARLFMAALQDNLRQHQSGAGDVQQALSYADKAVVSLQSLDQLLKRLLDISRFDSGAVLPDIREFGIAELIMPLETEFSVLAAERGLTLHVVASSAAVATDPDLLRQVLQNFLLNAISYTPNGRVLLGCRRRGDALRIEVWDTGIGIPESRQREIFEEFCKLTPEGIEVEHSHGLGLAIVDRIARLLALTVIVKSSPGHGSMFAIEVPMARSAGEPSSASLFTAAPDAGTVRRLWILCIDNDESFRAGMTALLEQWGHSAVSACGCETALARLGTPAPDMVLVDYHLDTEENGLDVLARLRQIWEADVPALLITADQTEKIRSLGRAAGVEILYKPPEPAALRSFLNGVGARAGPPSVIGHGDQ